MGHIRTNTVVLAVVIAGAAQTASAGLADFVFRIEASNSAGSGFIEIGLDQLNGSPGFFNWSLAAPVDILDTSTNAFIATLEAGNALYIDDPVIGLGFAVRSGATDTTFSINSGNLQFGTIGNVTGRTSASLNVTDVDGNGVTATGNFGGLAWTSRYNGGLIGGTTFADIISPVSAGSFGSFSLSDEQGPAGSFLPIAGTLTDTFVGYNFTLTANDTASGNGIFVVVPAPASALLLAGGCLASFRRRR